MKTQVCSVSANVLKGLLKVASKFDTRFYLNGIYFDVPNGRLVTTDGNALLIVKHKFAEMVSPFIMPRELIERALKLASAKAPDLIVSVTQEGARLRLLELSGVKGVSEALEIDAKYPDYARVVPLKLNGKSAAYNPEVLARVQNSIGLVRDTDQKAINAIEVVTNGDGPALVASKDPNILAVVMPWNIKAEGWALAALASFQLEAKAA